MKIASVRSTPQSVVESPRRKTSVETHSSEAELSLRGVGTRGPWMHDGCAHSLEDRFYDEGCGGHSHGEVEDLTSDQIADLVAYLRTL